MAIGTGAVRAETPYTYDDLAAPAGTGYPAISRLTNVSACQTNASCDGTAGESETVIAYAQMNLLPSSVTRRDGAGTLAAVEATTWDDIGNPVRVDGPLPGTGDTSAARYNLARQVTGTISPDPDGAGALPRRAVRYTYIGPTALNAGLVEKVETGTVAGLTDSDWAAFAPLERVEMAYDGAGRPVRRTLIGDDGVAAALTQTNYDDEGLARCAAVRMNPAAFANLPNACALGSAGGMGPDRIAETSYNARHQPASVVTALGTSDERTESSTYTANGRLETVTDGRGSRTTWEYDGHDRMLRMRYPKPNVANESSDTDFEEYGRDANGNVTSHRLRSGNAIAYAYDALNRVTSKDPPGAGEATIAYAYDNLSRLVSASAAGGQTLTFTYDALGRNLTQVGPRGTTAYQYDLAGRRTRMTYPDGNLTIGYTYLVTGEVTHLHHNPDSANFELAEYVYDDRGRRTRLLYGNGRVTRYAYDPVSRLEQLSERNPADVPVLTTDLTYNPASQIRTLARSNDNYAFTGHANGSDQLDYNRLNQLLDIDPSAGDPVPVTHNARGDITVIGSGPGEANYGYTSESLMTSAPDGVTMAYDPLMRLYEVVDPSAGSETTDRFAYDGATIIAEYGGANTLRRRWIHGPGVDQPLVWIEGTGTPADRRWLHADERGSIIAVSDGNGQVTDINRYDEYGNPQGGTIVGRFGYTGQAWLPEIGMWYYRARIYNPAIHRFMQPDPIRYGDGLNLYAYVHNDPINLVDPSGLDCDYTPEERRTSILVCGRRPLPLSEGARGITGSGISGNTRINEDERQDSNCNARNMAALNAAASRAVNAVADTPAFNTPSELALLEQYFAGDTTPYRMSASEFDAARAYVARYPGTISGPIRSGGGYTERLIGFGTAVIADPALDGLLGIATGIFRGNELIGITDTFDFDIKGRGGYPHGWAANIGVILIRADAASCSGNVSIPVTGGTVP